MTNSISYVYLKLKRKKEQQAPNGVTGPCDGKPGFNIRNVTISQSIWNFLIMLER